MSFEMLSREHDEIEQLCGALDRITADCAVRRQAAAAVMGRLRASMVLHIEHEDLLVYSVMGRSNDARLRHEAEAFLAEFSAVRADCRRYLAEWTGPAIERDWQRFCHETPGMLKRMRARAAHEDAVMYPLALERGCLPYRAASG